MLRRGMSRRLPSWPARLFVPADTLPGASNLHPLPRQPASHLKVTFYRSRVASAPSCPRHLSTLPSPVGPERGRG